MIMSILVASALLVSESGVALPGDGAVSATVPDSSASDPALAIDSRGEALPGVVEALDGAHFRGGQHGEIATLLDGVPITSPLSGAPLLLIPDPAIRKAGPVNDPDQTIVFSGLSGGMALVTREAESPGISGSLGFGLGSMEIEGMQPMWHPSIPSHETRPLLEDCYTASGAVEWAAEGMLPGLTTLLVSGDFVSSNPPAGPSQPQDRSWRENWDNNGCESWSGLAKLGWTRSPAFEAGLTFALHERERGWSDWAWSRFESYWIDTDSGSSTYGDTLAGGINIENALPTRFDDGSLVGLGGRIGLGAAGDLGFSIAVTGSHIYDRIGDGSGGSIGDGFTGEDDWLEFIPPGMTYDNDGFVRSGVSDLLWYDFEDEAIDLGFDWGMQAGIHSISAGTGWILHDMEETSVTLLDSQTVTAWRNWQADPVEGFIFARDLVDLSHGLTAVPAVRLGVFDPRFDFTAVPDPVLPGSNTGGPLPGGSISTEAPVRKWLDPSVAIIQRLDDRHSISFEYARVSRMPLFVFLYPNTDSILVGEDPFVGNPDLDPERVVNITLGIDRVCPGRGESGISLFYRTMDDLVTTEARQDPAQGGFRQFSNGGSATVQGLELSHRAHHSDWLAWSVSYTLSRAEGTWSVLQEDQDYEWVTPWISDSDEFPLAWDRRHSLELSVSGEFPERAGVAGGLGAGLDWIYASGFPFDVSYAGESPTERNTGRYPDATRLDASVWRRQCIGGVDLTLKLDVVNVSQERNIAWIVDPEWYLADGSAEMDPTGPLHDPHAFAPPRHFFLGVSLGW